MEFQGIIDGAKAIVSKANPIFAWTAGLLSDWLGISQTNIHQFLILILSLGLAGIVFQRFKLKWGIAGIILFLVLRWLGL